MRKRVFISYKRMDQTVVLGLLKNIEDAINEYCWIDQLGIPSDTKWDNEIKFAIEHCEVFVFMCSKLHNSITDKENDWTYKEIKYAFDHRKHIEVLKIDNEPLPGWLKEFIPAKAEIIPHNNNEKLQDFYTRLSGWLNIANDRKKTGLPNDIIFKVGELYYRANKDCIAVEVCKAAEEPYRLPVANIPESIIYNGNEYEVVRVDDAAFEECANLKKVFIPKSVKQLGAKAFRHCSSLDTVVLSDGITHIGERAFEGCSLLRTINIPPCLTNISDYMFRGCTSLASIELHGRIDRIGIAAFDECSMIESLNIPGSVLNIGTSAFSDCTSLGSINLPENITEIEDSTFYGCKSLISITLPAGIKRIGNNSFYECVSLKSIIIPSMVETIGYYNNPFGHCFSLKEIVVEEGNRRYDSRGYSNAIIETETNTLIVGCLGTSIPETISTIETETFTELPILDIIIPEGVTNIESNAFAWCRDLISITLPTSLNHISKYAFSGCKSLVAVNIPMGTKDKFLSMDALKSIDGIEYKMVEY